jgi:hypothetical protein
MLPPSGGGFLSFLKDFNEKQNFSGAPWASFAAHLAFWLRGKINPAAAKEKKCSNPSSISYRDRSKHTRISGRHFLRGVGS